MIRKLPILFFLIAINFSFLSQEKKQIISGEISDSLGFAKNINIINLNTNQGTHTNDNGLFRIIVSEGDTLKFSSVQHISKKLRITKQILDSKLIQIKLKTNTYQLDEFELKKHNLTGRLGLDLKHVPKDKKDSILRSIMDFTIEDINNSKFEIDEIQRKKPDIAETDPNLAFQGVGSKIKINSKDSKRLWSLRRKLNQKKNFPYKILSELGQKFFFDQLKIPEEKYFHFLEYCNPLGIEDLHKKGKLLEVIKILRTESISYLKIIKNE